LYVDAYLRIAYLYWKTNQKEECWKMVEYCVGLTERELEGRMKEIEKVYSFKTYLEVLEGRIDPVVDTL
jgi:hypothetical protein